MKLQTKLVYLLLPFLFLLLYHQVFIGDYAYLDEIHQLWHHNDNSNFVMFHTQGRWLTGLLFQKLFAAITTIEQLKLLRIFSFAGWVITTMLWAAVFKKWVQLLEWRHSLWWLGTLYVTCSISVAIYIGWASCMEVFLGVAAALLSGHILFTKLYRQPVQKVFFPITFLVSMVLGVTSLFIYQTAFGVFLLPFFFTYLHRKKARPDKVVVTGILFYLFSYIVYYFLFQYSLHVYGMEASTRTAVNIQFFKKLSFFFSGPLPQGFSLNLLFSASSIFSQVFYPLVLVIWLVTVFKRNRQQSWGNKLVFILITLWLLAAIYLPLMIATENFPSYRTLFAFNLAVFIMVVDGLLSFCNTQKKEKSFTAVATLWLLLTGFYAFNFQYSYPLKKEYKILRQYMQATYKLGIDTVHFVRAHKNLFALKYKTRVYRDEFGVPSTHRDWVPEPIVKQLVFELTGDRYRGEAIKVLQYESSESLKPEPTLGPSRALYIDMNTLFLNVP